MLHISERFQNHEDQPRVKSQWKKMVRLKRNADFNRNTHLKVLDSTKKILKFKLSVEYDMYNFIVQRLHQQAGKE